MEAKDEKFKIEVCFNKNRHYPEYGREAYNVERHSIYIPYGKKHHFKSSESAINFVTERIDEKVLEHFDTVYYTVWRGLGGICKYLKEVNVKSDTLPIDKTFADSVLAI